MANDIQAIKNSEPVKNGTTIVTCSVTGKYSSLMNSTINTPTIADIENKYQDRWDERNYYTCSDVIDGGHI
jgi:hypothetical protein